MRTVGLLLCAAMLAVVPVGCGGDPSQENATHVQASRPEASGLPSAKFVIIDPPIPLFCDPGLSICSGQCVDLNKDFNNCGACGVSCQPPPTKPPQVPHTWRCVQGQCTCITCTE
jgi:hypothetical protein